MQQRQFLKIEPGLLLLLEGLRAVEGLAPLLPYQSPTSKPAHLECDLSVDLALTGGILEFWTTEQGPTVHQRWVTFTLEDPSNTPPMEDAEEDRTYTLDVEVRQESTPGSDSVYTHRCKVAVELGRITDRKEISTRMAVTVCAFLQTGEPNALLHMYHPPCEIVYLIE